MKGRYSLPYRVGRFHENSCTMIGCFESLAEAIAFRDEWVRLDPTNTYRLIDDET